MNAPLRWEAFSRQWTRATDRKLGALKVALTDVRVWLREERDVRTITYELREFGVWRVCERDEIPAARWLDVVLYVATDGLSADPRVAAVRVSGATGHTTVTMADGSVR